MASDAITEAFQLSGGLGEIRGTAHCDPWADQRMALRWMPALAITMLAFGLIGQWLPVFGLGAAMLLVAGVFGAFYGFAPHVARVPWHLHGNRLNVGGRNIHLDEIDGYALTHGLVGIGDQLSSGRHDFLWRLELRAAGKTKAAIAFGLQHDEEQLHWLAGHIVRSASSRKDAPEDLDALQRVRRDQGGAQP